MGFMSNEFIRIIKKINELLITDIFIFYENLYLIFTVITTFEHDATFVHDP
jgi:hypothetical protein